MDYALTTVVNYILLGFLCAFPGSVLVMMINPNGLLKGFGKWIDWDNLAEDQNRFWVKFWSCTVCWSLRVALIVGSVLLYFGHDLFLVGITILSAYYISDKL